MDEVFVAFERTPVASASIAQVHFATLRDAKGVQTVSRGEVWIAAPLSVGLQDRITLPDGTTPKILAAELLTDEAGPSHAHIYFG